MSPDDFPPPPAGLTRYAIEAGSFVEEQWTPSGASFLIDAVDDQNAVESAPSEVIPSGMTPEDGTHLRVSEAITDRTAGWLVLFPHREG